MSSFVCLLPLFSSTAKNKTDIPEELFSAVYLRNWEYSQVHYQGKCSRITAVRVLPLPACLPLLFLPFLFLLSLRICRFSCFGFCSPLSPRFRNASILKQQLQLWDIFVNCALKKHLFVLVVSNNFLCKRMTFTGNPLIILFVEAEVRV